MLKIVSVEQMRKIEAAADASGYAYAAMMENAGTAAAKHALKIFSADDLRVTVLVGKGNNGGDGLVAARVIAQESKALVRCYLLGKRDDDPLLIAARQAGVHIADAEDDQGFRVLRQMVSSAHLVLDALFGIGIRLPLHGDAARLLQIAHAAIQDVRSQPPGNTRLPYVLAIDCPSGLDCDSGALDPSTIPADETITFIAAKPGLLTFPGASAVGQLTVAPIDMPADLPELDSQPQVLVDTELACQLLPPRPLNSHKGTYGTALIIGGSTNYRGAVGLSALAAYGVGAGLVTVCTENSVVNALSGHILEATWLPQETTESLPLDSADALLIGPGWGQAQSNRDILNRVFAQESLPPLIMDADGLNLLAEMDQWWEKLPPYTILTPHPGEMARLTGLSTAEIQANRREIAVETAAEWGVIVLLKGAHTLIASPDNGQMATLPFKTDALAKAGTGDVLAGAIAGLLAQGMEPYNAAVLGGYLHGLSGEYSARQTGTTRSVLAGQVAAHLGQALSQIERWSTIKP